MQNSGSLTALRGFRLLRVVKLAKNITSFRILVKAIAQTVVSLLPLFVCAAFAAAALLQQWRFGGRFAFAAVGLIPATLATRLCVSRGSQRESEAGL